MRRFGPFLAALLVSSAAHATEYVNDPLTAASATGRGGSGGTFSSSGWTTTSGVDTLYWEVPDALPTATVEYDVSGMSVGGTLSGTDHDVLCVYQAPTGSPEPIGYAPQFRSNDFKAFTRIFGTAEPGRGGAMKLELHICPRGAPWYHDEACPDACYRGGLAYANGTDKDVGWDPSRTYHLALSWTAGRMAFSRDGTELGAVTFTGTYAPQPLRVRLGSPRHALGSTQAMPVGITIKNMKVTGTAGTMTATCSAPTPDAGPVDAGASVVELDVLQDVTADKTVTGVFPDVNDLATESDGTGPNEVVYLQFPAIMSPVKRAVLRLHTAAFASATGGSGAVHGVATTFDETTLTWSSKPAWDATAHGEVRTVDPDQDVEWDVTALAAAGTHVFAIVSADTNGAHYLSKEADKAHAPKLRLELSGELPDTGAVLDAGRDVDASMPDSGRSAGGFLDDEASPEGCGCRTAPPRNHRAGWLLLGLGLLLRVRPGSASAGRGSRGACSPARSRGRRPPS